MSDSPAPLVLPEPLPIDRAIQQLDGLANLGYQDDAVREIEVAIDNPVGVVSGPEVEPVSKWREHILLSLFGLLQMNLLGII